MLRMHLRAARVGLTIVAVLAFLVVDAGVASAAAPTISSFTPASGPVGTSVQINGDNFSGPDPDVTSVKFNGVSATFTIDNPHKLTAIVPSGATTGPISVTSSDGTATSASNFTVTAAAVPTISSFNPTSGPVGTSVTITGTNFGGATSVKFNGTNATFTVSNSNTQITATVPSGATTGPISVTTPGGTATSSTNFTVTLAGAPTITSFSPTSGPVGTSVTITGTNFTGTTSVKFNGVTATFTITNQTHIATTVPAGATTGPISVTNATGTATSSTNFTVTGVTPTEHDRTVSLSLSGHIKVTGNVNTTDGTTDCESKVGVKIQKQKSGGGWKTLTTLQTNTSGGYKGFVPDKVGKYRARVPAETLVNGVQCGADSSGAKSHKH